MKDRPTREIERQLQALRLRVRRVQLMRGGLLMGAVFLGGLLISMAADWIFAPLPAGARWTIFLLWMGALVWAGFVGFAPFFQKLSLIRIARWLESRHPELEERLSSALELSGQNAASAELLESLVQAAEEDALLLDASNEVRAGRGTKRWRWMASAAALILLLTLIFAPRVASRLIVRSVAPFSNLGNAGAFQLILRPGDLEVMAGGAIEVRLDYSGADPPEIILDLANGTQVAQPFRKEKEGWIYRMEPARESFLYRARAGRALSDHYSATVHPQPRILEGTLKRVFPKYTGLLDEEGDVMEGVEAVIGTDVALSARLNTPVQSTWIELPSGQELPFHVENSSEGASVSGSIFMTGGLVGEAILRSRHRLGNEVELVRFPLRALEDRAPEVTFLSPQQMEIKVHPSDEIPLGYEVKEDFGLKSVVLELEGGGAVREEMDCELPLKIGSLRSELYRGSKSLRVAELMERFQGTSEVRVRLRAEDKRPPRLQGPGRGFSGWLVIRIDQGAQSLAQRVLTDEHRDARDGIEKAIRATREAEQKMQQNHSHLVKGERNEHSQKLTAATQEKLGEAQAELKELAARMEQGIHAAKVPEVVEAAGKVSKALRSFEEVPLQDGRDERHKEMEEAFTHTREAIKQLEQIRNQIDQDKSKVDDLARLESLAQKQRELARQANKQAEKLPQEKDFTQWQEKQKAVAEEVKSQLWNRPEAMAEVLGQQAEEARELAEKSRDIAAEQKALSELAGAIEQGEDVQSESEQDVREQIKQAQQSLAQDISKASHGGERVDGVKESLKEAAREAREMVGQIAQKKDEQAMQSAERSEGSLRKASDLSTGNEASGNPRPSSSKLTDLADRQEALALSAEALANDDPMKAARFLAESQQARSERSVEKLEELLETEQGSIAGEIQKQLTQAREAMSPLANEWSEAAARAQSAKEAFQNKSLPAAAEEAGQSAESLKTTAAKAQELAKSGSVEASAATAVLSRLAECQEQVAKAAQALSAGQMKEALTQLQELSQAEASSLRGKIQSIPQLHGSALGQAGHESQRGEQQAKQAYREAGQGNLGQAVRQHGEAERSFEKTASSLEKAARQLAEQAQKVAQQPERQHLAPTGAGEMAEAFRRTGQAAREEGAAGAAKRASQAAKALAEAAQSSRQQMQGRSPAQPSAPDQRDQPTGMLGEDATDVPMRQEEQAGGVPPELARLGIDAEDWEKIQNSLNKDVGGEGDPEVPADYRGLVKDYFQTMSEQ
ncbi:hypothetical protein [Roseibacillus persicicus]|uniref:hypothetical protein n=1 Tax=Roseibacillus persicicus TaxID=454148 RepID=UPI00280D2F06|nr:hypothetical protein [Roseibacillus persicicus]MDQ8191428.1 hypothetical protein [Roseibacillus persicicus]